MELADLARTMARYRWLILLFVAVGVGFAWLTHYGEAKMFTASTRLVLDTPDPESRAESAVIADTAKAIATSPSQVRSALTRARVIGRDPDDVARTKVSVRALGSSGIVQLSVRDRDPKAAALIANALAVELIETRLDGTKGEIQQVLRDLDKRITGLNRRISTLDARISSLAVAAEAAADAASANALRSKGDGAERLRDFLAQQRSVIEAERVSLLSTEALQLRPSVIDEASPPARADTSRAFPDMVLAGLLALIFGVGAAGLIEMVRPTAVRGGSALARKFNTVLLGTLPGEDEDKQDLEAAGIAARLAFAADAAGVTNVSLLGIGRPVDIDVIARRLEATLFATTERAEEQPALAQTGEGQSSRGWAANVTRLGRSVGIAALDSSGTSVRPHGAASPPTREGERTGLVIVSPVTLGAAELDAAVQLVRGTPLPLLGLIATASTPPQSSELGRPLLERQHQPRTMP